jgi:hypothetical protein
MIKTLLNKLKTTKPPANHQNVSVVAIARNEAAYLTEWVYHHLQFGFHKLIVGINRTDDQSLEVLGRLKRVYGERLHFEEIDFIDKATRGPNLQMQNMSYAYLAEMEVRQGNSDAIMMIDIDEFWTPSDFQSSISDVLENLPEHDMVSFHWCMQDVDEFPFSPPFKNTQYYVDSNIEHWVKTLFKTDCYDDIQFFGPHRQITQSESVRIDASGIEVEPKHKGFSQVAPDLDKLSAFVLHRVKRSEIEYLAHQKTPAVSNAHLAIRPMVNNYRNNFITDSPTVVEFPFTVPDVYYENLQALIERCELSNILSRERQQLETKAENFLDGDMSVIEEFIELYLHKSLGTFQFPKLVELVKDKSTNQEVIETVRAFCEQHAQPF